VLTKKTSFSQKHSETNDIGLYWFPFAVALSLSLLQTKDQAY